MLASVLNAFSVGLDVLATSVDQATNAITATLGDSTGGATDGEGAEFMFPPGLAAVPAPPTPGSPSAQAFTFRQGDRDIILGIRDARAAAMYGNLKPGEAALYATVGAARVLVKADGSVTLYTTHNNTNDSGKATFLRIGPGDVGLQFVAPFGTFAFDPTGLHIRHASGAKMSMGPIGGLPGPLAIFGSQFQVSASLCKVAGSLTLLGASATGNYNPATYGLAENPLTMPGVPIVGLGVGVVTLNLFTSSSVRVAGSTAP